MKVNKGVIVLGAALALLAACGPRTHAQGGGSDQSYSESGGVPFVMYGPDRQKPKPGLVPRRVVPHMVVMHSGKAKIVNYYWPEKRRAWRR